MGKISYAITVCDEGKELERLLCALSGAARNDDELVVVYDLGRSTPTVRGLLEKFKVWCKFGYPFAGDFAALKNFTKAQCHNSWVFQIDADEMPGEALKYALHDYLDANSSVDLVLVPRINIVHGLTPDHLARWGWRINESGHVNFPDYQARIYRNKPEIRYGPRRVHETITGHTHHAHLPAVPEWCLMHVKDIARQERQNELYAALEACGSAVSRAAKGFR
jgi:hypothetical protein